MEEHDLITRLQAGDTGSITDIINAYKDQLFAFIVRMTGDRILAEDIFQETWLRVIRSIHRFRGESKFSTWLFQIALNLCRDTVREKRKWRHIPIEDCQNVISCCPSVDPVSMVRAEQIRKIITDLPDKMREVIILRYYHDKSEREIADIISCPVGTIKSRLHRASEILRTKMEKNLVYKEYENLIIKRGME